MDSQKTISQEGDGVRYEKKMENILDSMWYMFPGWDHMLWCSVGNWNNTEMCIRDRIGNQGI